jgi:hypothetical protein
MGVNATQSGLNYDEQNKNRRRRNIKPLASINS